MLNPTSLNLNSHHSLKSSSFHQGPPHQYLNPVSSRPKLTKKLSLNSKNQSFCAPHHSNNQLLLQTSYQQRTPRHLGSSPPKHDMIIPLGNKIKQIINQNPLQNIKGQISNKIDFILMEIEKHNKRLSALQLGSSGYKQQVSSICNTQFRAASSFDITAITRDICQIKKQLSKMMNRDEINKQIKKCSNSLNQNFLEMKREFQQHTKGLQTMVIQITQNQIQIVKNQISQLAKNFEKKIEQLKLKPNLEYVQYFYETGSFVQKMVPLLKNPNLRLKFCGKVSLIDLSNKNPESEHLQWQIQNFTALYMIDEDGTLLDDNKRYLLDSQGKFIRLNHDQVQLLLKMNILQ